MLRCVTHGQDFKEFEALDFGEWEALPGGVRWHLALRSPGASSLALLFRCLYGSVCIVIGEQAERIAMSGGISHPRPYACLPKPWRSCHDISLVRPILLWLSLRPNPALPGCSNIRLPVGGELAIYAPSATADRTRCDGDCMLLSAFDVPATHRLTTLPITGKSNLACTPTCGYIASCPVAQCMLRAGLAHRLQTDPPAE